MLLKWKTRIKYGITGTVSSAETGQTQTPTHKAPCEARNVDVESTSSLRFFKGIRIHEVYIQDQLETDETTSSTTRFSHDK